MSCHVKCNVRLRGSGSTAVPSLPPTVCRLAAVSRRKSTQTTPGNLNRAAGLTGGEVATWVLDFWECPASWQAVFGLSDACPLIKLSDCCPWSLFGWIADNTAKLVAYVESSHSSETSMERTCSQSECQTGNSALVMLLFLPIGPCDLC